MKTLIKAMGKIIWIFAIVALIASCAGSKKSSANSNDAKQAEDDYIADLLGISQTDSNTNTGGGTQTTGQQDDNLLELLQENETGNTNRTATPATNPVSTGAADQVDKLESEVDDLQRRIAEKDRTIDVLKNQVDELESQTQKRTATPSYTSTSTGTGMNYSSGSGSYKQDYQAAYSLFQSRRYRDAINAFEAFLADGSTNSLSDNAQYWIGESHYALGDYSAAIVAFEKVFTYKNSNKNDYSQYKLGQCYYMLKDYTRSRQEFQTLIDNYKNSSLISRAQGYLRKM